jgi:hypothetical protein
VESLDHFDLGWPEALPRAGRLRQGDVRESRNDDADPHRASELCVEVGRRSCPAATAISCPPLGRGRAGRVTRAEVPGTMTVDASDQPG